MIHHETLSEIVFETVTYHYRAKQSNAALQSKEIGARINQRCSYNVMGESTGAGKEEHWASKNKHKPEASKIGCREISKTPGITDAPGLHLAGARRTPTGAPRRVSAPSPPGGALLASAVSESVSETGAAELLLGSIRIRPASGRLPEGCRLEAA